MARQILWKKTLHAPWYFVSRTQGREIWTQVLPSLICFYLNPSFSFFREKALSPCSENYTTGPFQSPPLSCPVSSAVLHISQKRRPTPIQVNSDGPRACSRESRAEMQTFRRAAFTRRRQEHTHSRDSAPRQNRRATRQHTPGHTPHGHTWEHTCYPQIPPPAVHDARVTRSVGPQPLPARNWPAVGWARHSRPPPPVASSGRDAAAAPAEAWNAGSCRAIAGGAAGASGQGGNGLREAAGAGSAGTGAWSPARRTQRSSRQLPGGSLASALARSLELPPGFPLSCGPGSCRRGNRAHSLPGTPGCGRASPGREWSPSGLSPPAHPKGTWRHWLWLWGCRGTLKAAGAGDSPMTDDHWLSWALTGRQTQCQAP